MGRNPSEKPKNKIISFGVSEDEYDELMRLTGESYSLSRKLREMIQFYILLHKARNVVYEESNTEENAKKVYYSYDIVEEIDNYTNKLRRIHISVVSKK
jgi:hypothetical protein